MPLSPEPAEKSAVLSPLPQASGTLETAREDALRQAPGRPVLMLRPAPVKVRAITCHAIAYTVTHVLVERDDDAGYQASWEASWLVRRL
jgi:hypothetical protein